MLGFRMAPMSNLSSITKSVVASLCQDADMLRRLLNHGVAADSKTRRGKSALQLAMKQDKGGSHSEAGGSIRERP